MENAMNTLRQSPEKMRAMREALKRSTNPPADAFMYAEFAALPLNMFQRVCSFVELRVLTKLYHSPNYCISCNIDALV